MLDRFRDLSPGRQWALVGVIVTMLVTVLVGIWGWTSISYRPLFKDLRTADAATIVAELDKRKIPYRLGDGGATVLVPADKVDGTRLAVTSGDLPLKGTVGFELFNKSDMGVTDFAQRINYQRALQGELERTIMTLDRVETARVHLSLGENRLFRDDRVAPKASVTMRMENGSVLGAAAAAGVQRLVAAAVPQLDASDVVILDEAGQLVTTPAPSGLDARAMPPATEAREAIAEFYESRIREALTASYPGDAIAVAVVPAAASSDDLAGWNSAARDFPLTVTLAPKTALDPGGQADVRALAGGAIGFDAARGDMMTFGPIATAPAGSAEPIAQPLPATRDASAPSEPTAPTGIRGAALLGWGALAAAALAIVVLWLRRRPQRLSASQRSAMAQRLRTLLDGGGNHAVGA